MSSDDFHKAVLGGRIDCVHTSLGSVYGCDATFGLGAPKGAALFYAMRNYSALPAIKMKALERKVAVFNVFLFADQESINSRLLYRSDSVEYRLRRFEQSARDIIWLGDNEPFVSVFFDLQVNNSDVDPIHGTEQVHFEFCRQQLKALGL